MKRAKYQITLNGVIVGQTSAFNTAANKAVLEIVKGYVATTGEEFSLVDSGIVKDHYLNAVSGHRTWKSNSKELVFVIVKLNA